MLVREIDNIKIDPEFTAKMHAEAMNRLEQAGIIAVLRAYGRPRRIKFGENVHVMASEASYYAGWSECLDALQEFMHLFIPDTNKPEAGKNVRLDFNALHDLQKKKIVTEEEANAIRLNRKPDYSNFTNNLGDKPATPDGTDKQ